MNPVGAVHEPKPATGRKGVEGATVSVIVPVTAPTAQVRDVVVALSAELERLGRDHEFILVFDGVRGAAWQDAQALVAERPRSVQVLGLQQSFGESMCLSAGYEKARGPILLTSPQYVQVDPAAIGPMLAELDRGADFVTSWRHPRVDPWLNRLQSALFNWVTRRIIHVKVRDLNCTFRVFRREVLDEMHLYGDMYRFLPAIAFRQGFRVTELQVRHLREWGGAGLFGIGVYARRLLDVVGMLFLAKFTLKPLRFFGAVGGLLAFLGACLCVEISIEHLIWHAGLYNRMIFIIGFLMIVLGVQIIGFGLVGEIIIYTQARNLREYRVEKVWERRDDSDRG
ncbi:MAG TPA: glycosyltransferase [Planctomycetota bacterium]|jgi:glycosyltransferase involved in cell wall biosynthesis|nr:glycosyltransferase [Planctomycetota bacterium]